MKHKSKDFDRMLKIAEKHGFKIVNRGKNVTIIPNDPKREIYIAHPSDRAYHPLRRYLKKAGVKV